ncbi:MAG TPA: glycosyltransferase family 2 protein [Anaerolineales bacterium]|nr:glycosyltransferase family 2 protein [Anaerolineales bacterium]
MNSFSILIPVLNEAGNVPRLVQDLRNLSNELQKKFDVRVILIDDGSQDNTSKLAKESAQAAGLQLTILRHEANQGPGKAFATGFCHLSTLLTDNDLVLTMEGDNTSRLELVKQMLIRLNEGFDVIFASPYMYGGKIVNTSVYRIFLSSMANLFIKELLGIHGILTVSSFFRLYRAHALNKLQATYGPEIVERCGFECMVEMTMKMMNLQLTISEVPMVLDTHARAGKSRMKIAKTIRGYFSLWLLKKKWLEQAL